MRAVLFFRAVARLKQFILTKKHRYLAIIKNIYNILDTIFTTMNYFKIYLNYIYNLKIIKNTYSPSYYS